MAGASVSEHWLLESLDNDLRSFKTAFDWCAMCPPSQRQGASIGDLIWWFDLWDAVVAPRRPWMFPTDKFARPNLGALQSAGYGSPEVSAIDMARVTIRVRGSLPKYPTGASLGMILRKWAAGNEAEPQGLCDAILDFWSMGWTSLWAGREKSDTELFQLVREIHEKKPLSDQTVERLRLECQARSLTHDLPPAAKWWATLPRSRYMGYY
jgi:hypothetical protein